MRILTDKFGRVHDYLVFAVTDRRNLNSLYLSNENKPHKILRKSDMLSNDESYRLIKLFISEFRFNKIRITGGEPLVRKGIMDLFESLGDLKLLYDFTIGVTTNGTLLFDKLSKLKQSGVTQLNINLDTLDRNKFIKITGKDKFQDVMNSIDLALKFGFDEIKINCVVVKGLNDDEIPHFAAMAYLKNINIRFIEYIPLSANDRNENNFVSVGRMKDIIRMEHNIRLIKGGRSEVAENFQILGSTGAVSFISSISDHFCDSCNRLKITSNGHMKLCLFPDRSKGIDLKSFLRNDNCSDSDICDLITNSMKQKKLHHQPIDDLNRPKAGNPVNAG